MTLDLQEEVSYGFTITCLVQRDIAERGRTVVDVLEQYNRFVKPAYDDFIKPTMKFADIIVPFSTENANAVNMLVQNLKIKMEIAKRQFASRSPGKININ